MHLTSKAAMVRSFLTILLAVSCWTLPEATDPAASSNVGTPQTAAPAAPASPESQVEPWTTGKVSLVRGLLKSVDPIHDVLVVHVFGGGDLRILFDARTQLFQKNSRMRATGLTPGTVVSVDTVIDNGKLFARTVRTDSSNAGELNGQVVRYDAGASQVTIRDAMSPKEISLRITGATAFVSQG